MISINCVKFYAVALLVLTLFFELDLSQANFGTAIAFTVLGTVSFIGIGIAASVLPMMYVERGAQMVFVLQSVLLLVSGVYYSIDVLPEWMQFLNMNPPHFHILMIPFTVLPLERAAYVWLVVNVAAAVVATRVALKELHVHVSRRHVLPLLAVVFTSGATGATMITGQLTGLLMLPIAPVGSSLWNVSSAMHDNFADQIGWPELVDTVAGIYAALPADERSRTAVLALSMGASRVWPSVRFAARVRGALSPTAAPTASAAAPTASGLS